LNIAIGTYTRRCKNELLKTNLLVNMKSNI
jgi:hypothetical protein